MPRETTLDETAAMATALATANGSKALIDTSDVSTYLRTQNAPAEIRSQFLTEEQSKYIAQALRFLLQVQFASA